MAEKRELGKKRKRPESSELEIGVEEFLSRNCGVHNDVWRLYELMRDLDGQSGKLMGELGEDMAKVKKLAGNGGSKKPGKGFNQLTKSLGGRLSEATTAIKNLGCTKV